MSETPVVFPYPPDGLPEFIEGGAFLTNILTARNRREQRIALREIPGGRIEMLVKALDAVEMTEVLGLLYSNQHGLWQVPLWPLALPTSAALSGGEQTIPIEPPVPGYGLEVIPWQLHEEAARSRVLLYRSPTEYQVLDFAGIDVTGGWGTSWGDAWGAATPAVPSAIRVSGVVQGEGTGWGAAWGLAWGAAEPGGIAWPAGSLVVPLRLARLDADTVRDLESIQAISAPLAWELELEEAA